MEVCCEGVRAQAASSWSFNGITSKAEALERASSDPLLAVVVGKQAGGTLSEVR